VNVEITAQDLEVRIRAVNHPKASLPGFFRRVKGDISNGRGPDTSSELLHSWHTEVPLSVLDFSWGGNGSANYFINNGAR
jgi:hypothetical protein